MTDISKIQERIKTIISEQLDVPVEEITPQSHIVNDLGADSLDSVELVMALEDAFSEEFPDGISEEEAEKLQTVGDLFDYVEKKLG